MQTTLLTMPEWVAYGYGMPAARSAQIAAHGEGARSEVAGFPTVATNSSVAEWHWKCCPMF
jgi:hypothetical protein